jgi:hypothetical protein
MAHSRLIFTSHARQRLGERGIPESLVIKCIRLHWKKREILVVPPERIRLYGYTNIAKYLVVVLDQNCIITLYWIKDLGAVRQWYIDSSWCNKRKIRFV